jgi:hypothetical protein
MFLLRKIADKELRRLSADRRSAHLFSHTQRDDINNNVASQNVHLRRYLIVFGKNSISGLAALFSIILQVAYHESKRGRELCCGQIIRRST